MTDRYKKSMELLARAEKVIPGGAQTLSKMPCRYPLGAYPVFLKEMHDATVMDVDGNRYIDFICGLGAITLGDEMVEKKPHVDGGTLLSLCSENEVILAERLCRRIPCAEMVRFVRTGSESMEAACRVARMATGRDVIVCIEGQYHGWFSWHAASRLIHVGVPAAYATMIRTVPYNDQAAMKKALRKDVAAVVMEPTLYEAPDNGYLHNVQKLCKANGSLLVFDEAILGFRFALAGGQEYFGVTPDLAAFSKACAGGYPLGFLCGKAEYMQHATVVSGTFAGELTALLACMQVLWLYENNTIIDNNGIIDRLWQLGTMFQEGFNDMKGAERVGAKLEGYAVKPKLVFANDPDHRKLSIFLQETAKRGVLIHPSGPNFMYRHSDAHICSALAMCREALCAIENGVKLEGALCQPNPFRAIP
jgi:glutamate-1-semialdehyde 2,1-aminomutase